jgi:hypothetical protein
VPLRRGAAFVTGPWLVIAELTYDASSFEQVARLIAASESDVGWLAGGLRQRVWPEEGTPASLRSSPELGFFASIAKGRWSRKRLIRVLRKALPDREESSVAERIKSLLVTPIKYREGGRIKVATHREIALRKVVDNAGSGDLGAAALVLRVVGRAERHSGSSVDHILVKNWLPDYSDQTASQKAADVAAGRNGATVERSPASED